MAIFAQAEPLELTSQIARLHRAPHRQELRLGRFPRQRAASPSCSGRRCATSAPEARRGPTIPSTLKPGQFTLSLVHQPVGKYAACHSHEVVEHFLVLSGVLTVGWAWGDEVIEARLGPMDMVLNETGRPHGFRNDGVEPVLVSISVGSGMPKPPVYVCHPRDRDAAIARRFGASPGKTRAFDPALQRPSSAPVRPPYRAPGRAAAGMGSRFRPVGLYR